MNFLKFCLVLVGLIDSLSSSSAGLLGDGCELKRPVPASEEVLTSFVASYPGSGSSMVRVLIPALTGLKMGVPSNVEDGNLDFVALKTHYPFVKFMPSWADQIKRVVILLRNPMSAIPSYCNFVYEHSNGLETHTVKAPTDYWVKWRDQEFSVELEKWVELVDYWMENENIDDRFVLPYEDVVNKASGPETASELADFFNRSPGVQSIAKETIPCVWTKLVQKDEKAPELRGGDNKRVGPRIRDYTMHQLEAMVDTLTNLSRKYTHHRDLVKVLNRYIIEVSVRYQSMLEDEKEEVA